MASVNNRLTLNDQMTPALKNIVKALEDTMRTMQRVNATGSGSMNTTSSATRTATSAVYNLNIALNQTAVAGRRAGDETSRALRKSSGVMEDLIQQAKGLAIAYFGIQGAVRGIAALVQGGDTFIGNVARLDLMNDGLQTTAQLQNEIYKAAQRSLGNYNEMTASVAKLGITARHAFGSSKEIVAFSEILNKQFSIAGASQSEKAGAMYQLTQAMGSGRLQGDEFRSILENAPLLAATIAKTMGMNYAQMKEASSKGKITADIIKNAMFKSADEINEKFKNMPMRFQDLWIQVVNKVVKGLEPLNIKFKELWNNKQFQTFIDGMTNGFVIVIGKTITLVEWLAKIGSFIATNWSIIAPILGTATALLGVFFGAQIAGWIKAGIAWLAGIGQLVAYQFALFKGTAAQYGLNAAIALCPLSWFFYAVVAIIGVLYIVVAAVNKFAGTSVSATGIVAGVFSTLAATLWNIFLALGELIWGVIKVVWNIIAGFANFFANVMDNPISAWIYLFRDMANIVIGIIGSIASAIDSVFGSHLADAVNGWKSGVNDLAATAVKELAKKEDKKAQMSMLEQYEQKMGALDGSLQDKWTSRIGYKVAWDSGYDWGNNFQQKGKDMFKVGDKQYGMDPEMQKFLDDLKKDTEASKKAGEGTEKNTKKVADQGVEIADEDMELLKDVAKVQFVNKFTNLTPNVNASFGNVYQNADVNKILQIIEQSVLTAVQAGLSI